MNRRTLVTAFVALLVGIVIGVTACRTPLPARYYHRHGQVDYTHTPNYCPLHKKCPFVKPRRVTPGP